MIGARVGLVVGPFAGDAVGISADELGSSTGSGPLDTTGALPGQVLVVGGTKGDTTTRWAAPHPYGHGQQYWEFENGGSGSGGQGLNIWSNAFVGAGSQRLPLTGEPAWFANAASFETGTTTTGSCTAQRTVSLQAGSTSGALNYEATISIPVLSDGTDTYSFACGLTNSTSGLLASSGAFVRYTHSNNSGKFEFVAQTLTKIDDPERPPLNKYIPTYEDGKKDPRFADFPLQLLSPHSRYPFHIMGDERGCTIRDIKDHRLRVGRYRAHDRPRILDVQDLDLAPEVSKGIEDSEQDDDERGEDQHARHRDQHEDQIARAHRPIVSSSVGPTPGGRYQTRSTRSSGRNCWTRRGSSCVYT